MTITCAIIDDEPLALDLLESYVRRTPFLELKGKYSSAIEALEKTSDSNVDLLFLDIQMPGLSGIEFSRMVAPQTRIIFTTAFEQYALEGFKVNAIDYLMKPISYADFLSAVNKVIKWFDLSHKSNNASGDNAENPNDEENIFVRSEHHLIGIKLSDIQYLESLKDYVLIQNQARIYACQPLVDGKKPAQEQVYESAPFVYHSTSKNNNARKRLRHRGKQTYTCFQAISYCFAGLHSKPHTITQFFLGYLKLY